MNKKLKELIKSIKKDNKYKKLTKTNKEWVEDLIKILEKEEFTEEKYLENQQYLILNRIDYLSLKQEYNKLKRECNRRNK